MSAQYQPPPIDPVPPFMRDKLPQVDPPLNSAFVQAREKLKQQQATRAASLEAKNETNAWKQLIAAVQKETKRSATASYDPNAIYAPRDVIDAAYRAAENYEEKGSIQINPFRALARGFGENHSFLEVLLEFIPDGEYTGVLCGALTVLLTAAAQVARIRKSIGQCLQSLSGRFGDTDDWLKIYNNEQSFRGLWSAAEDMYIAMLQASQNMICWLIEPGYKHFFRSFLKYKAYSTEVEANTKGLIDDAASAFRDQVELCLHQRIQQTYELVEDGSAKMDKMLKLTNSVEQRQIDQQVVEMKILGTNKEMELTMTTLLRSFNKMRKEMHAKDAEIRAFIKSAPKPSKPSVVYISIQELHQVVAVPPNVELKDLETARILGRMLSSGTRRRAAAMLKDESFHSWLAAPSSRALLLNGMDRSSSSSCSAVTYCIAQLSEALMSEKIAVTITFLCGEHLERDDPLFGTLGMMRSLCAQLLSNSPVPVELFLPDRRLIEHTFSGDIMATCDLFRLILIDIARQLGGRICVVCLLDDISELEESSEGPTFRDVIDRLLSIRDELASQGDPIILKLLLGSRTTSASVEGLFQEDSILTMPEHIYGDMLDDVEPDELLGEMAQLHT